MNFAAELKKDEAYCTELYKEDQLIDKEAIETFLRQDSEFSKKLSSLPRNTPPSYKHRK